MKRLYPILKNKFAFTLIVFMVYSLFLDENDIFTMISNHSKLKGLDLKKVELTKELDKTNKTLNKLQSKSEMERYAREKKFFKKDDEDLFVIFKSK